MRRRALLSGLLAGGLWPFGCDRKGSPAAGGGPTASTAGAAPTGRWRELAFAPGDDWQEPEHAVVLAEAGAPLLVALHGRGEAGRGVVAGARGWRDDYQLERAERRLREPPLTTDDFEGFVRPERLAALNASLERAPYRSLAVACPYTPALFDRSLAGAGGFARFVTQTLIPRVRAELALRPERTVTAIDGVSMGGRLALLVGLSHPGVFGAVSALQPAISTAEAPWLSELAQKAMTHDKLALRLVSSDGDPFLNAVATLSRQLTTDGVPHELLITPGPHDYAWNRGPGAIEMLLWHERVARGLPAP